MCWKLNVVCAVENAWCGWNDASRGKECRENDSVNLLSIHKSFSKHRKSKSKKTPRLLVTFDTAY